ncbi:MerR family transcriptional regulator [Cryptosporangium sp. NPDC048952]|uniref:MerR family transcriptional regulator n=1 Tax=Cryptosporangium sp. NPDC048952 TaxID=3363961 RepID=UPI0037154D18
MKAGWSTRELADLAGTTVKTVRHYHLVGLLPEPERARNGYKQYRVTHFLRLSQIRRFVGLGVSLADIGAMEESAESAGQVLSALDEKLVASIERQQRVRDELAEIRQHRCLTDLPPGFGEVASELSSADRAFLLIASRIVEPSVMDAYRELYKAPRSEAKREFDALPEDASEDARRDLAERYAHEMQGQHLQLCEPGVDARIWTVVVHGIAELHNSAQRDVLQRMSAMIDSRCRVWRDVAPLRPC